MSLVFLKTLNNIIIIAHTNKQKTTISNLKKIAEKTFVFLIQFTTTTTNNFLFLNSFLKLFSSSY